MHLASSLHRLNRTIKSIYATLSTVSQLDSALIILASDHSGCYDAGGHIGDLRGCEGTLVKGGFKVNAFMLLGIGYTPSADFEPRQELANNIYYNIDSVEGYNAAFAIGGICSKPRP
eukprot:gene19512-14142_t